LAEGNFRREIKNRVFAKMAKDFEMPDFEMSFFEMSDQENGSMTVL
jgi:hypothetical protein